MGVDMTLEDRKKRARADAFVRRKIAFETKSPGAGGVLSSVLAGYRGVPTSGYMPINTEINPTAAMAEAAAHGSVCVPVIQAKDTALRFAQWSPDTVMVEGAFKAMIPRDVIYMTPEIVIVPLVAWDRNGGRLGYGGGFYDRTLQGLRAAGSVLAIGFAFEAQEAKNLPLEGTDQPLDMIVTETQVISFRD